GFQQPFFCQRPFSQNAAVGFLYQGQHVIKKGLLLFSYIINGGKVWHGRHVEGRGRDGGVLVWLITTGEYQQQTEEYFFHRIAVLFAIPPSVADGSHPPLNLNVRKCQEVYR